jgi:hypothetical protein
MVLGFGAGSAGGGSDPILTALQITTLQAGYYLALGLTLTVFSTIFGDFGKYGLVDLFVFSSQVRNLKLAEILAHICVVPITVRLVVVVCDHGSQVLDFVVTLYTLHLVFCLMIVRSFPTGAMWWSAILVEAALTCGAAEFLASRRDAAELGQITAHIEAAGGAPGPTEPVSRLGGDP